MKTITEMQAQIKEMSSKLDEFARDLSDYNGAGKQDAAIDFKQIKAIGSRNPIEGHVLVKADADVKKKYITMLVAIGYLAQEKQENAWLLIQRIATGADFKEELIDVSVDAINLTDAQIDEFTLCIANAKLTNAFVLDAMLIYLSCEHANEKMLDFLSALFELVKCSKKGVEELSELARIIAEQNTVQYLNFLLKVNAINLPDHNSYIKPFHFGIQYIDLNCCIISGNGKNKITDKEIEIIMATNSRQLIIENIVVDLKKQLEFTSRDSIIFNKCNFTKTEYPLRFISCNNIEFNNCLFTEMSNRVAYIKAVSRFKIENSQFLNCGWTCDGDKHGGVFYLEDSIQKIEFINSKFDLCYIAARSYRSNYGVSGCIMYGNWQQVNLLHIHKCEFSGCECKNNGNYTETLFYGINCNEESIKNNIITGKLQKLFD